MVFYMDVWLVVFVVFLSGFLFGRIVYRSGWGFGFLRADVSLMGHASARFVLCCPSLFIAHVWSPLLGGTQKYVANHPMGRLIGAY
jgi:hypothetical protein